MNAGLVLTVINEQTNQQDVSTRVSSTDWFYKYDVENPLWNYVNAAFSLMRTKHEATSANFWTHFLRSLKPIKTYTDLSLYILRNGREKYVKEESITEFTYLQSLKQFELALVI